MRRVVLSSSRHRDYDFFLPLTAKMWQAVTGYSPLILLSHDEEHWRGSLALEGLRHFYFPCHFIGEVEESSTILTTKLARYYAACLDIPEEDYLLLSDIDLWPLEKYWFCQQDWNKKVHILFANAHGYAKFPTCYVGMTVGKWREFIGSKTSSIKSALQMVVNKAWMFDIDPSWSGWLSDEEFVKGDLLDFVETHDTQFIEGDYAKLRVDRAEWPQNLDLDGKVDAHLLRPGWDDKVWKEIRQIIQQKIPRYLAWADEYQERYRDDVQSSNRLHNEA
jgi:hypothetical protein